jgi:hypothetical protein
MTRGASAEDLYPFWHVYLCGVIVSVCVDCDRPCPLYYTHRPAWTSGTRTRTRQPSRYLLRLCTLNKHDRPVSCCFEREKKQIQPKSIWPDPESNGGEIEELVACICTRRAAGLVYLSRSSGGYAVRVDEYSFCAEKKWFNGTAQWPDPESNGSSLCLTCRLSRRLIADAHPVLRACCTFRGRREVMQYVRVNIPCVRRKNISA